MKPQVGGYGQNSVDIITQLQNWNDALTTNTAPPFWLSFLPACELQLPGCWKRELRRAKGKQGTLKENLNEVKHTEKSKEALQNTEKLQWC